MKHLEIFHEIDEDGELTRLHSNPIAYGTQIINSCEEIKESYRRIDNLEGHLTEYKDLGKFYTGILFKNILPDEDPKFFIEMKILKHESEIKVLKQKLYNLIKREKKEVDELKRKLKEME